MNYTNVSTADLIEMIETRISQLRNTEEVGDRLTAAVLKKIVMDANEIENQMKKVEIANLRAKIAQ